MAALLVPRGERCGRNYRQVADNFAKALEEVIQIIPTSIVLPSKKNFVCGAVDRAA